MSLTRHGFMVGPYLTYKHETVLPALLAALILCMVAAVGIFGDALARAAGLRCDWLTDTAVRVGRLRFFKILLLTFAGQILVLLILEAAEQTLAFGQPLGLIAIMGAPLLLALVVHALAALSVSLFLFFLCRGIVAAAQKFARSVGSYIRRLRAAAEHPTTPRQYVVFQGSCKLVPPLAQHLASRPPPSAIPIS